MRFLLALLFATATLAITPRVMAYNATGHKVMASICFRRLEHSEQQQLIAILQKHPRFQEDFRDLMPSSVQGADENTRNEWLFQQAAIWPDLVKSGPSARTRFNRARWHFINVPYFLSNEARDALEDHVDVNLQTEPPESDRDDRSMNILAAIKNSVRIIHDDSESEEVQAIHICWLLHCVGDLHQPLHSTALFSERLFPQGDRGGNSVKTQPLRNLHAAWDAAMGAEDSFLSCRNLAIQLISAPSFQGLANEALALPEVSNWRDDLVQVAVEHAYSHEVILQLQSLEANDDDIDHNPVRLSDDYLRNRGEVVKRLVTLAGVRCAFMLTGRPEPAAPAFASPERAVVHRTIPSPSSVIRGRRDVTRELKASRPGVSINDEADDMARLNQKLDRILVLLEDISGRH